MTTATTLVGKIWDAHAIRGGTAGPNLVYVDLHLIHEASSPQAFDGLRLTGRKVRRPELVIAVEDHNVPTDSLVISDPLGRLQVSTLRRNCELHGIELFRLGDRRQGIVHVVAPERGHVLPGMTIACGDSHTSTLGAFGALAFGIGTSDVEHVLATQTVTFDRPRTMAVEFTGSPPTGVTPKDLALALLAEIGANGAQGHAIEYRGRAVEQLSMEGRMTLCNMSIEAGARAGLVAPDEVTFRYLAGRPHAPSGEAWRRAESYWRTLRSDDDAVFDRVVTVDTTALKPYVSWGTNPGQAVRVDGRVPDPASLDTPAARAAGERALAYMGLEPGVAVNSIEIDTVFLGSCTNGRIEDLEAAAEVLRRRTVADGVRMLVVPGSMEVRAQAESRGLDRVFVAAGAEWRLAGCSMCPGMNPDRISAPRRCVSTSNRNYEGRQGPGARTHLASPEVAAASAVLGRIGAPDELPPVEVR